MVGHKYTEEEHKFLQSFIPGHTYKEIVAEYNKRFDEPITETRVKGYMANHKINNGLTGRFKKGHIPANKGTHPPTVGRMAETQFKRGGLPPNTKPVGYERITKDGYVEVKIKMRPSHPSYNDNFKAKHHIVWEEAHGPIPKGYVVMFADGNKRNFDLDNLILASRAEVAAINTLKGVIKGKPELTKMIHKIVKVNLKIKEVLDAKKHTT